MMNRYSNFERRRDEAELKARQREEKTGRAYDLLREGSIDEFHAQHMRPYCANCDKLKGSKAKNRYYPTRPCSNCGSIETRLRDFAGNEIRWEKWVVRANEAAEIEAWNSCGGPDRNY
jgi:hypothetical protein